RRHDDDEAAEHRRAGARGERLTGCGSRPPAPESGRNRHRPPAFDRWAARFGAMVPPGPPVPGRGAPPLIRIAEGTNHMGFKDKVALVTGAGSGIGEAIARELAGLGAKVVVADINAGGAGRVADSIAGDGGQAAPFVADSASPDDNEKA